MPYKIQVYMCGCWNDYIRHTKTKIHLQMEGTEVQKTKIFKSLAAAQALVLELTRSSLNCKILIVEPPIQYVLVAQNDMYFAGFKKGILVVHK